MDDDDDEFDTSGCQGGDRNLLRDELQSLDKNVLDFYGVVLDFNKFGQQVAKTTKRRSKPGNNQGDLSKLNR